MRLKILAKREQKKRVREEKSKEKKAKIAEFHNPLTNFFTVISLEPKVPKTQASASTDAENSMLISSLDNQSLTLQPYRKDLLPTAVIFSSDEENEDSTVLGKLSFSSQSSEESLWVRQRPPEALPVNKVELVESESEEDELMWVNQPIPSGEENGDNSATWIERVMKCLIEESSLIP